MPNILARFLVGSIQKEHEAELEGEILEFWSSGQRPKKQIVMSSLMSCYDPPRNAIPKEMALMAKV